MSATMRIKALVKAAEKARALLNRDRASMYESHVNPATKRLDSDGQQACDEYDDAIVALDAAIAKAKGGAS